MPTSRQNYKKACPSLSSCATGPAGRSEHASSSEHGGEKKYQRHVKRCKNLASRSSKKETNRLQNDSASDEEINLLLSLVRSTSADICILMGVCMVARNTNHGGKPSRRDQHSKQKTSRKANDGTLRSLNSTQISDVRSDVPGPHPPARRLGIN